MGSEGVAVQGAPGHALLRNFEKTWVALDNISYVFMVEKENIEYSIEDTHLSPVLHVYILLSPHSKIHKFTFCISNGNSSICFCTQGTQNLLV